MNNLVSLDQTPLPQNSSVSENRPLISDAIPPNNNSLAEMEDFSEIDRKSLDKSINGDITTDHNVLVEFSSRIGEVDADPISSKNNLSSTGKDELDMRNINGDMRGFPYAPGYGLQDGFVIGSDLESIPDVNVYQHKKTLAQGMMDLALFSANANQLRYVLESSLHPYFYPNIVLITLSLFLQIAVGVGLLMNSRYNVKDQKEICIANKINNYTVVGIFIVTSVNVFISAFGVAPMQVQAVLPVLPSSVPIPAPIN